MEFIIELILDLFFDSVEEVLPNSKISKRLRVILGITACVIIGAILSGVFILGVIALKESVLAGGFVILIDLLMAGAFIYKIIKTKKKAGL